MLEHAGFGNLPLALGWPGTDEAPIKIERRELRRALPLYVAARELLEADALRLPNAADARPMCLDLLARRT